MKLDIHARNFHLTDALSDHITRSLQSALNNFASKIESVTVRLEDSNGPRGGKDMACHLQVDLRGFGSVIIEHQRRDVYAGIDEAADRAKRTVRRRINRRRILLGVGREAPRRITADRRTGERRRKSGRRDTPDTPQGGMIFA